MNKAIENFKSMLKKAGYKITPPRLAILSLLEKAQYPLPAHTIAGKLTGKIDQATVYRNLDMLKKISVIKQVDFEKGYAFYELADHGEDHHHIVCVVCEKVSDVHGCHYKDMSNDVLREAPGFAKIVRHSLEFFGVCKACEKKR